MTESGESGVRFAACLGPKLGPGPEHASGVGSDSESKGEIGTDSVTAAAELLARLPVSAMG